MGGEHWAVNDPNLLRDGRSPRGRGTQDGLDAPLDDDREIPAWAGNTGTQPPDGSCAPGDPRVGGEHCIEIPQVMIITGRSPRGRGTRLGQRMRRANIREIPAWAGNTGPIHSGPLVSPGDPRVGGEHA